MQSSRRRHLRYANEQSTHHFWLCGTKEVMLINSLLFVDIFLTESYSCLLWLRETTFKQLLQIFKNIICFVMRVSQYTKNMIKFSHLVRCMTLIITLRWLCWLHCLNFTFINTYILLIVITNRPLSDRILYDTLLFVGLGSLAAYHFTSIGNWTLVISASI